MLKVVQCDSIPKTFEDCDLTGNVCYIWHGVDINQIDGVDKALVVETEPEHKNLIRVFNLNENCLQMIHLDQIIEICYHI